MVRLSVVMSVYNGARSLARTMDSILVQTMHDFELLVVDDGSTDTTPAILAGYAERDARVRVLTQPNTGLTHALIRGCAEARGDLIARHDCGDRSEPRRFAEQLELLEEEGHVLVSCGTRFVDEEGDLLFDVTAEGNEVRNSLLTSNARRIGGIPHHGSAMFRRDAYLSAGGYRPQFRLAQDLDLWLRMARIGSIGIVDEILYEAVFTPGSISGSSRTAQVRLTELAVDLRNGGDPRTLLALAEQIAPALVTPHGEAAALYFIGKCLLQQRNPKGRAVLREAVRKDPWHWKAWISLLLAR